MPDAPLIKNPALKRHPRYSFIFVPIPISRARERIAWPIAMSFVEIPMLLQTINSPRYARPSFSPASISPVSQKIFGSPSGK